MEGITLDDYRFKLGVKTYHGIIHAEQGMAMFYCEGEGVVARLPFFVSADLFEQPFTAYMHDGDDTIFTELDYDDILVEDIRSDMLDVSGNWKQLEELVESAKLALLPKAARVTLATIVVGISTIIVTFLKWYWLSSILFLVTVGMIFWTRGYIKTLDSHVVYDRRGRWVDLETGRTNLNKHWRHYDD